MIPADDQFRYAMTEHGYYIGKPIQADGTIGQLSLAEVTFIDDGTEFASIRFERVLTERELEAVFSHPVLSRFVLKHAGLKPDITTWMFMCVRFCATEMTSHHHARTTDDPIQRVAV